MKKSILVIALLVAVIATNAQQVSSAGKWYKTGQSYVLGSDKASSIVLKSMNAYNSNNADLELSFYTDSLIKATTEFTHKWHDSLKTLDQKPFAIIPLRLKGDDNDIVLMWSTENRLWKDGSKQKVHLMEVYGVNKQGKISSFNQWSNSDSKNEFGLSTGGKLYGKTPGTFVFSNRGETEVIEKLNEAYNKMDAQACSKFFADTAIIYSYDGSKQIITAGTWVEIFANFSSVSWNIGSTIATKIANTDPASGALVMSREKRVFKDGTIWEKNLVENFFFDLEGKISSVTQFAKDLTKK